MNTRKILIIEDDPNIREVLKLALDFEGYEVFLAKNGREGLEALSKVVPDLILLDLMMPVMNGWEFVDELKKKSELPHPPIVVVSAYSERAKVIECSEFVQKPLDLDTLLRAVKRNLRD